MNKKHIAIIILTIIIGLLTVIGISTVQLFYIKPDSQPSYIVKNTKETKSDIKESSKEIKIYDDHIEDARPIRICFAGDILLSRHVLGAYDAAGDIRGIIDDSLLDTMRDADICMVNQEFPFATIGTPSDKQYTFRVEPDRCKIFTELGIDIVTLANNHALDYGRDALVESLDTLDRYDIKYVGAGRDISEAMTPIYMDISDKTIGFIAASRVVPYADWTASSDKAGMFLAYDPTKLIEVIKQMKDNCDYIFVYLHWGIEKNTEPESYQVELAHKLIDAGADAVIGSHPHVLQKIDFYNGIPIAYSLGNFMFNANISSTELLCIDIEESGTISVSIIPAAASSGKTYATSDMIIIKDE